MSRAIEDRHDQVQSLISMGKERGYVLYGEVNDILPAEVYSSEETDDLLLTLERSGIDIYEDVSAAKAAGAAREAAEALEAEVKEEGALGDEVELDLTPGLLEKTNDPVRVYLREMGAFGNGNASFRQNNRYGRPECPRKRIGCVITRYRSVRSQGIVREGPSRWARQDRRMRMREVFRVRRDPRAGRRDTPGQIRSRTVGGE